MICTAIALMMEAAHTSEMWVDIQLRTQQYIPEDSELQTHCRENLKSHIAFFCSPHGQRHCNHRVMKQGLPQQNRDLTG
jgi:hypothetical protein